MDIKKKLKDLKGEGFHSNSIEKTKIKSVQKKIKTTKKPPSIKSILTFRRYVSSRVLCIHQSWAQH